MPSDFRSDTPPRIHCEAISPDTPPVPNCHRPHRSMLRRVTDPAILIGLALGHVREGEGLTGFVPDTIVIQLQAHADDGNPACRLLLDWLARRNGDRRALPEPHLAKPHPGKPSLGRRFIHERRRAGPGSLKRRGKQALRPSVPKAETISATQEGHVDG